MRGKRIIDLTHVMIPGQEQYGLKVKPRVSREGLLGDIMSDVSMWSHVGTHVEAPLPVKGLDACLVRAIAVEDEE
jgi:kynurenine formamidase